ncbi:hypothetical protein [Cupriavidus basilensis]|nr:hypothetical protein [Cupriavidus basilensis]NUA28305.1 hypothetical protein [Cupriavidus basilensis]
MTIFSGSSASISFEPVAQVVQIRVTKEGVKIDKVSVAVGTAQHVGAVHPGVLYQHTPTGPDPEAAGVA